MHIHSRFRLVAAALAVSVLTGACTSENPAAVTPPAAPMLDGGVTFGSGSRDGTLGGGESTTTAADSGSTARGVTLGSGS